MNNPAVNHDAARQNIQFTANYHVRILITSVLYFTAARRIMKTFIWIKRTSQA